MDEKGDWIKESRIRHSVGKGRIGGEQSWEVQVNVDFNCIFSVLVSPFSLSKSQ